LDAVDAGLVAEVGHRPSPSTSRTASRTRPGRRARGTSRFVLPAAFLGESGVGAGGFWRRGRPPRPGAGADFYKSVARIVRIGRDDGPDGCSRAVSTAGARGGRPRRRPSRGAPDRPRRPSSGPPRAPFQARQHVVGLDRLGGEAELGAEGGRPAVVGERRRVGEQSSSSARRRRKPVRSGRRGGGRRRRGLIGLGQKTSVRLFNGVRQASLRKPDLHPFSDRYAAQGTRAPRHPRRHLRVGLRQDPLSRVHPDRCSRPTASTRSSSGGDQPVPALYARKGIRTPKDSVYLNHLLAA
jgi:hypothetical protein